ncbi:MAG: AAA family ATPase [bacterium]|nr:AAA family ATPase [bacterium]
MKKRNAIEYLREHTSYTEVLIAEIIKFIISNNGKYSTQKKEQLFESLLQPNINDTPFLINSKNFSEENTREVNENIAINSIKHVQGVNALQPNQKIDFSNSLTIIYGLNGSGKSGYFRILNELVGASIQKDIVPNIHSEEKSGFKVEVDFHQNGHNKLATRNENDSRGIKELAGVQVFDSHYFPKYLKERESEIDLEPFGLHLFEHITELINESKQWIGNKIEGYKNQNMVTIDKLQLNLKSEATKNLLRLTVLSKEQEKTLMKSCFSSKEDEARVLKFKKQISDLKEKNSEDTIKLKNQKLNALKKLKDWLEGEFKFYSPISSALEQTINQYAGLQETRNARLKEFEAITKLPNYQSDEWYQFIKSGSEYRKSLSTDHNNQYCLYCKQPLQEEALKLVSNYAEFLKDESESNLKKFNGSINTTIEAIKDRRDYEIDELLNDILSTETKNRLQVIISKYSELQKYLSSSLESKKLNQLHIPDISSVTDTLTSTQKIRESEVLNLSKSSTNKQNRIKKLNGFVEKLENRLFLHSQKNEILQFIQNKKELNRLQKLSDKLNTRGISQLSKKAHEQLLTSTMSQAFNEQIQAIKPSLKVEFKSRNETGTNLTKLQIVGYDVKSILSEGEQKSVGLALFLAELKCQNTTSPVIFDDPVTSLDHEIIDSFAKQLLNISVYRQVIIFTHNKLFLDSLAYWSGNNKDASNTRTHHVCKNYEPSGCNSTKGKHVRIYELKTLNVGKSGAVFPAKLLSCNYFLQRSKKQISEGASYSEVSSLLKNAIEHFVDENILVTKPLKDRNKGVNIPWEKLQKIGEKKDLLPQIKLYWDTLSSRGSHISSQSSENPISYTELNNIIDFLSQNQ